MAVVELMSIKAEINRFGRELHCHRPLVNAQVTQDMAMQQIVNKLPFARRQALILWIAQKGPYWDDDRRHRDDDWLEVEGGELVTDHAIGEAAYCMLHGTPSELVSIENSRWSHNPICVFHRHNDEIRRCVDVENHWKVTSVATSLRNCPPAYQSWKELEEVTRRKYSNLTFATHAFEPLCGHPYISGVAQSIDQRLHILNRLCDCFEETGGFNNEGKEIWTDYFTGSKAWFSDSSESEKNDFEKELTFPCPGNPELPLFCPWHGKIKTPQTRIHFSSQFAKGVPVYVVYVGPKITKR